MQLKSRIINLLFNKMRKFFSAILFSIIIALIVGQLLSPPLISLTNTMSAKGEVGFEYQNTGGSAAIDMSLVYICTTDEKKLKYFWVYTIEPLAHLGKGAFIKYIIKGCPAFNKRSSIILSELSFSDQNKQRAFFQKNMLGKLYRISTWFKYQQGVYSLQPLSPKQQDKFKKHMTEILNLAHSQQPGTYIVEYQLLTGEDSYSWRRGEGMTTSEKLYD